MRAPFLILLFSLTLVTSAAAADCSPIASITRITASGPSCFRLPSGRMYCDPGVPVQIAAEVTTQNPALPPCGPFRWEVGGTAKTLNTLQFEHTFGPGHHYAQLIVNQFIGRAVTIVSFYGDFMIEGIPEDAQQLRVSEKDGTIPLTIFRNDGRFATTVDYTITVFGPPRATPMTGTISFAPGELRKPLAIPILNDELFLGSGTGVTVKLSNPTNGYGFLNGSMEAQILIVDDEPVTTHGCAVRSMTAREADGSVDILLARTGNLDVRSVGTVEISTTVTSWPQTKAEVTFEPGESEKSVKLSLQDTYYTGEHWADVRCSGTVIGTGNGTPSSSTRTVESHVRLTVQDDDAHPVLTVTPVRLREADVDEWHTYTISLSHAFGMYAYARGNYFSGPSTPDYDFDAWHEAARFAPRETTAQVRIKIVGDDVRESEETFRLVVEGEGMSEGMRAETTLTIEDDDAFPMTLATQSEYAFAGFDVRFDLRLPAAQTETLVASVSSTQPGVLTVPSTVTIPAGTTSVTFVGRATQRGKSVVTATLPSVPGASAATTVTVGEMHAIVAEPDFLSIARGGEVTLHIDVSPPVAMIDMGYVVIAVSVADPTVASTARDVIFHPGADTTLTIRGLRAGQTTLSLTLPPVLGGTTLSIPIDVNDPPTRRRTARH